MPLTIETEMPNDLNPLYEATDNYLLKRRHNGSWLPLFSSMPRTDHSYWDYYNFIAIYNVNVADEGKYKLEHLKDLKKEILEFDRKSWFVKLFLWLFTSIEWKRALVCAAEFSLARYKPDGSLLKEEKVSAFHEKLQLKWSFEKQLSKISPRSSFYSTAQSLVRLLKQPTIRTHFETPALLRAEHKKAQQEEALGLLRLHYPGYFDYIALNTVGGLYRRPVYFPAISDINPMDYMRARYYIPRVPSFADTSVYQYMIPYVTKVRVKADLAQAQQLRIAYERALPVLINEEYDLEADWQFRHSQSFKPFKEQLEHFKRIADSEYEKVFNIQGSYALQKSITLTLLADIKKLYFVFYSCLSHPIQLEDLIDRIRRNLSFLAETIPELDTEEPPSQPFSYHLRAIRDELDFFHPLTEEQIQQRASLHRILSHLGYPYESSHLIDGVSDGAIAQMKKFMLLMPRLSHFMSQLNAPQLAEWLRRTPPLTPGPVATPTINRAQSTHTASVHRSVSESARKLLAQYRTEIEAEGLERQLGLLVAKINALSNTNQNLIAKRCIARITAPGFSFEDRVSGVSLRQLLGLVYLAIYDEAETTATVEDRMLRFIDALNDIQRGYNTNPYDSDRSICIAGTFNKLIECLSGSHSACQIRFISKETLSLKFSIVVKNRVQEYFAVRLAAANSVEALQNILQLADRVKLENGPAFIWEIIKAKVAEEIFAEFGELYLGPSDPAFLEFLETGQYVSIDLDLRKEIENSPAYHAYCSRMLRSHGLFARLASIIPERVSAQEQHDRRFGLVVINPTA